MTGTACFLFLLHLICMTSGLQAQRSPYSLQAAVDELHRREAAKYPLNAPPSQQHYLTGALGTAVDQDYWDDDSDFPINTRNKNSNSHRLNKLIVKYLERQKYKPDQDGIGLGPFGGYIYDEDNNQLFIEPDENKRSSYFRERNSKYESEPISAFRERDTQATPVDGMTTPEHSELTEQFLREIEEAQEREREERYKDALRNLWEKYQQQENEIEDDLFEQKKRMRMPPYYMLMQKKRSYPVLPWLPYTERRKRFPVAKRSTKHAPNENINLGKTDDKVAEELSELFGSSVSSTSDEKKKRSTDEQTQTSSTLAPGITSTTSNDIVLEIPSKKNNATETAIITVPSIDPHEHRQHEHRSEHAHSGHAQKEQKHSKRSDHHVSHESHEDEEGSESEEHEDDEGEEEDEEEFEEEEIEERKKKRDLRAAKLLNLELFRGEHVPSSHFNIQRQKKSIDWSKYFGIDRKKKAIKLENAGIDIKKRSTINDDADQKDQDKMKRELDPTKLDKMDRKLQSIENFIIDETIKYTGAHEGIANIDEIRRLKDHVLSRLATAYSLEKMRRALEKLRQTVEAENHLLRNVIEPDDLSENELDKRLSVKKEQAPLNELENIDLSTDNEKTNGIHSNAMMSTNSAESTNKIAESNGKEEFEQVKKHKKKRNGYLRYPELPNEFRNVDEDIETGRYESLNDAYLGNKNYIIGSHQCPLIESIIERCRGVDLLSGDINQEFLPICGEHQICYLCSTSQVACDYQYLTEADSICGNNNDCQAAARSILMILRGTLNPQLGPRECMKNSCLHSAMREIGL
ncbi:uncharacterized protein LOC128865875 isoform X1 [Anastrepha ludens]|uniref:uncharacterized protein LOC128865875 isoform X1 n=1 Tax=Anastrepha ludens TaxID=28586 RepID=UPI0023AFC677|nr:uncharacterized protein LOC128865875 isoform X1 [Anastrepha ludens]XP_053962239.1 uncharacterized protein LOC128865875 isoform X1 [Anastrepha ludens]XP_053962240.1 uncharacterized protein LOC128865875 isoform X1 [Anastrepha ludens]